MGIPDLNGAAWRRSSYSNISGGECVEVGRGLPGIVPVRDSRDPRGPVLLFSATAWTVFVNGIKAGAFPGG